MNVSDKIRRAYRDGTIPEGYTLMIISASQLDTFAGAPESCQRKWWWSRGLPKNSRLPEPPGRSRTFGTVLHEVVARYLNASDTGADTVTGLPVELFPDGWESPAPNYKGEVEGEPLTVGERRLTKALVTKAIEEGHVVRETGREIEAPFWRHLGNYPPVDACQDCGRCEEHHTPDDHRFSRPPGRSVFLMGYIDLLNVANGQVLDHKTTSNMRWAKSAKKIANATPMLVYACELLFRRDLEAAPLEQVELVHVAYCKDVNNTKVRRTSVTVPVAKVESFYKRIGTRARSMVDCAARVHPEHWREIPGAMDDGTSRACGAYGGCPFVTICGGRETVQKYRRRLEYQKKKKEKTMALSLKEAMKKRGKRKSAPPAAPLPGRAKAKAKKKGSIFDRAPKMTRRPAAKPAKKNGSLAAKRKALALRIDDDGDPMVMPWSQDECVACAVEGVATGISSKGSPCRVCVSKSTKDGGPTPDDFDLSVDEKGRMVCGEYETAEVAVAAPPAKDEVAEPDPDDYKTRDAWLKDHGAWCAQTGEEGDFEWPAPVVKKKPKPKKSKTPATLEGCVLLIGAVPIKPTGSTVLGATLFAETAQSLADHEKKESYWELDCFRRRDQMAQVAVKALSQVQEAAGEPLIVVFSRPGPEEHNFIEALKAAVGTVIAGTL